MMNLLPVEWKNEENVPTLAKELDLHKGKMLEVVAKTLIGAPNPTIEHVMMLAGSAKSMGLNMFEPGMIYLVERGGKSAIQVGRQAFRRWKLQHPLYAGEEEPQFHIVDGQLRSCKFTVYRWMTANGVLVNGPEGPMKQAFHGIADWDAYCPVYGGKPSPTWLKFPKLMLSKCAEVQAIRAAFADVCAAAYISEEMQQMDKEPERKVGPAEKLMNSRFDMTDEERKEYWKPNKNLEEVVTEFEEATSEPAHKDTVLTSKGLEGLTTLEPQVEPSSPTTTPSGGNPDMDHFMNLLKETRLWEGKKIIRLNTENFSYEEGDKLARMTYTEAYSLWKNTADDKYCDTCGDLLLEGVCPNGC